MSPHDTGRQLWGNPGIVSFRQFRDNVSVWPVFCTEVKIETLLAHIQLCKICVEVKYNWSLCRFCPRCSKKSYPTLPFLTKKEEIE